MDLGIKTSVDFAMVFYNILLSLFFLELLLGTAISSENMAKGKESTHNAPNVSTGGTSNASLAIDGCLKQYLNCSDVSNELCPLDVCCSVTTQSMEPAWWTVDMGTEVEVQNIKIYTRRDGLKFDGYRIFGSNTSDYNDGILCEENGDAKYPGEVIDNKCNIRAQYITITHTRNGTIDVHGEGLELCEVQVFGCQVGKYGDGNCMKECPTNCIDRRCHPHTGQCYENKSFRETTWQGVQQQGDRLFPNPDITENEIRSNILCLVICTNMELVSVVYHEISNTCYCYRKDYAEETTSFTSLLSTRFFKSKP